MNLLICYFQILQKVHVCWLNFWFGSKHSSLQLAYLLRQEQIWKFLWRARLNKFQFQNLLRGWASSRKGRRGLLEEIVVKKSCFCLRVTHLKAYFVISGIIRVIWWVILCYRFLLLLQVYEFVEWIETQGTAACKYLFVILLCSTCSTGNSEKTVKIMGTRGWQFCEVICSCSKN